MKKCLETVKNALVTVSCVVGVGFVSGNEIVNFVGNYYNALLFALCFFALTLAVRLYCQNKQITSLDAFTKSIGSGDVLHYLLLTCNFVAVITMFSGIESCIGALTNTVHKLPVYSFLIAVITAFVVSDKMKGLKVISVVSTVSAVVFIGYSLRAGKTPSIQYVSAVNPLLYAFFNFTLMLAILTKQKDNVVATSVVSTTVLLVMIVLILVAIGNNANSSLPLITGIETPFGKLLAFVTVVTSAMSSIVSCSYPIVTEITSLTGDKTFAVSSVMLLAVAFSITGLDFAVKYVYPVVALLGVVIAVMTVASDKATKKERN